MGLLGKKKEIGPDTIIQRRNDLLFNEVDGEVVMLSIENGEYYGMDQVGSRIWELIEQPIKIKELVACLIQEYKASEEICTTDLLSFISKLRDKKILIVK